MNTLDQAQEKLAALQAELLEAQQRLEQAESDPSEIIPDCTLSSLYDDFLDEIYAEVFEALPINLRPSVAIQEHDLPMYNCGYNDWLDSLDVSDFDEYKELVEEVEALECQVEELEEEIELLEEEA